MVGSSASRCTKRNSHYETFKLESFDIRLICASNPILRIFFRSDEVTGSSSIPVSIFVIRDENYLINQRNFYNKRADLKHSSCTLAHRYHPYPNLSAPIPFRRRNKDAKPSILFRATCNITTVHHRKCDDHIGHSDSQVVTPSNRSGQARDKSMRLGFYIPLETSLGNCFYPSFLLPQPCPS